MPSQSTTEPAGGLALRSLEAKLDAAITADRTGIAFLVGGSGGGPDARTVMARLHARLLLVEEGLAAVSDAYYAANPAARAAHSAAASPTAAAATAANFAAAGERGGGGGSSSSCGGSGVGTNPSSGGPRSRSNSTTADNNERVSLGRLIRKVAACLSDAVDTAWPPSSTTTSATSPAQTTFSALSGVDADAHVARGGGSDVGSGGGGGTRPQVVHTKYAHARAFTFPLEDPSLALSSYTHTSSPPTRPAHLHGAPTSIIPLGGVGGDGDGQEERSPLDDGVVCAGDTRRHSDVEAAAATPPPIDGGGDGGSSSSSSCSSKQLQLAAAATELLLQLPKGVDGGETSSCGYSEDEMATVERDDDAGTRRSSTSGRTAGGVSLHRAPAGGEADSSCGGVTVPISSVAAAPVVSAASHPSARPSLSPFPTVARELEEGGGAGGSAGCGTICGGTAAAPDSAVIVSPSEPPPSPGRAAAGVCLPPSSRVCVNPSAAFVSVLQSTRLSLAPTPLGSPTIGSPESSHSGGILLGGVDSRSPPSTEGEAAQFSVVSTHAAATAAGVAASAAVFSSESTTASPAAQPPFPVTPSASGGSSTSSTVAVTPAPAQTAVSPSVPVTLGFKPRSEKRLLLSAITTAQQLQQPQQPLQAHGMAVGSSAPSSVTSGPGAPLSPAAFSSSSASASPTTASSWNSAGGGRGGHYGGGGSSGSGNSSERSAPPAGASSTNISLVTMLAVGGRALSHSQLLALQQAEGLGGRSSSSNGSSGGASARGGSAGGCSLNSTGSSLNSPDEWDVPGDAAARDRGFGLDEGITMLRIARVVQPPEAMLPPPPPPPLPAPSSATASTAIASGAASIVSTSLLRLPLPTSSYASSSSSAQGIASGGLAGSSDQAGDVTVGAAPAPADSAAAYAEGGDGAGSTGTGSGRSNNSSGAAGGFGGPDTGDRSRDDDGDDGDAGRRNVFSPGPLPSHVLLAVSSSSVDGRSGESGTSEAAAAAAGTSHAPIIDCTATAGSSSGSVSSGGGVGVGRVSRRVSVPLLQGMGTGGLLGGGLGGIGGTVSSGPTTPTGGNSGTSSSSSSYSAAGGVGAGVGGASVGGPQAPLGFQDEFMSHLSEFSMSWREHAAVQGQRGKR